MLVPLIVTRSVSERVELMKKVFNIFIVDKVPSQKRSNVVHTISCYDNNSIDGTSDNVKSKEYLTPMLDHLVQDCIKKCEIESFPFKLFARTMDEFLQENEKVLVPLLLWHYDCDTEIVEKLCISLKKKKPQLFR